jgi:gliding motility-associated-like protein
LKKIAVILFLVFWTKISFATHIVGGAFDVQWISGNSYRISLKVLRDCRNGQADFNKPTIRIGLYSKNSNTLITYFTLNYVTYNKLDFINPRCGANTIECTEEGYFTNIVTFPNLNSQFGYYISWERCCRNGIISNINAPGDASTAFYAEIPGTNLNNSTPKYTNNPVTLMCVGVPFTYNFNFQDADGDSLVYSLVDPLNGNLDRNNNNGAPNNPVNTSGPYQPIDWLPGFNANVAINGTPNLGINSSTGEINVTPSSVGTYVAAVCVKEYRNGVKIGEVRLELQFNVVICAPNPPPEINFSDTGSNIKRTFFDVEIPNNICFDINASDLSTPGDSIYMKITSPFFSSSYTNKPTVQKQVAGYRNIVNRFCWQTSCELSKVGSVTFYSEVKDNGCPLPRTSKNEIIVRIKPMRTIPPPIFKCLGLLDGKTQLDWSDTNTSVLLKSYRIYRGINDSNYVLLTELGKLANQFTDNNSPNNKIINYTYKITSVNECDSEGLATPFVSTVASIPVIVTNDSLNALILKDTIDFEVYKNKCFEIKVKDIGDELVMRISSTVFSNKSIGTLPQVDTLVKGNDSVFTTFCWTPSCEAYQLKYIPINIEVKDLSCPISNVSTKTIWLRLITQSPVESTDMLCMTLSSNNQTYVYYGDTSTIEKFNYFLVFRGIDYKNYEVIDTIKTKGPRYFLDKNSPNNKTINYTYFMIGVNKCGLWGQPSDTMGTFEQIAYIPQQQQLFTVTVNENDKIRVSWLPSKEKDFAKYFLFKSKDQGNNFSLIDTFENVLDTFYIDNEVNINKQSYCYHVVMYDTCDNIGPQGKIACSIYLKGISSYLKHNLDWNAYAGWENGVNNYDIERRYIDNKFESLVRIKPNQYEDKNFDTDEGAYYYYVNAFENKPDGILNRNLAQSKSNKIFLFQHPNVYPPNAFSANFDGLNDDLYMVNSFVKTFNLRIFNRWGQQIFETNNKKEHWKANLNDNNVQNDVYFYTVTYTGFDDAVYTKQGNFTILR